MKNGVCYLWPSFKENNTWCQVLDRGTLGSWSLNSDLIVTWTVPDGPKPEENDGSSAFLWNVNELRKDFSSRDVNVKPATLKSPFGEKVLWCRLVLDLEGNDRLIMALIGTTTRFLFWDVGSESHTHTTETELSTKDMPLASTKAWKKSRVELKTLKGLSPMAVTSDRSKFGAVLGKPSQVLIYDAKLGIQSLRLTPQLSEANEFAGGADILFSPTNGKIAMIGQHNATVFAPSTSSRNTQSNEDIIETSMIELDSHHTNSAEGAEYKLLFSGDGNTLGLLSIGYGEMQVYHLAKGTTCIIKMDLEMQDGILDFCFSLDGQHLVTSTSKMAIYVWGCTKKEGELIASVGENVGTIALGITSDTKQIIVCSPEGNLCYYTSSRNDESRSGQTLNTVTTAIGSEIQVLVDGTESQEHGEADERTPLLSRYHWLRHSSNIGSRRGMDRKQSTFVYTYNDRIPGSAVIGCRISANCERVAVVRKQGQLEVWNLKDKTQERIVPFMVSSSLTTISQDSIPLSGAAIPQERTRDRTLSWESFDQFRSDQENTVLPEKESFLLTNSIDSSLASLLQQTYADFSAPLDENSDEDLSSVYIVNHKAREHSRQLSGRNLDPTSGLAMSADGRHVACLAGKFASKIVVWSAYASQDLLPDYRSLSLLHDIKNKAVWTDCPPRSAGALNKPLLCSILNYGLEHNVKVSLLIPKKTDDQSPIEECHNAVEESLMRRSPEIVKVIMPALLKRVTYEAELSSILSRSLIHLHNKYPEIFETVIEGSHLFKEVCKIEVSECLFDHDEFLPISAPCLSLTECEMKKAWESDLEKTNQHKMKAAAGSKLKGTDERKVKAAQKSESKTANEADSVTLTASALAFPFYNACKFGRRGLLRYLLLDGAHHSVFGSFAIRAIVNFKWRAYSRKLLLQELIHHCLVSIAFTIYCFFLHKEETFEIADETGDEENSIAPISTLVVCWILAFPCLLQELGQCVVYITRHQWAGFVYWLKSGWNWMEVLSYFNIVVVIPLGHFMFANKGHGTIGLSVMAVTESLLLWSRMLFYARPFCPTGPFVIVIASLASTIMPFLLLTFSVMFGFALAFHTLYRHVSKIKLEELDDDSPYVSTHESFHTLENTIFTTFGFLFGEFKADDLYFAPNEPAAMTLFALYMVVMSIILLNMLIALMGERFEIIQKTKETRFIEARAKAVDDVDSMLSRMRKESLNDKIDTFLHVIVPSFSRKRIANNPRPYGYTGGTHEDLESKMHQVLKTASSKIVSDALASDSFRRRTSTLLTPLSRIEEHSEDFRHSQVEADASSDKSVHEKLDADSETRYE